MASSSTDGGGGGGGGGGHGGGTIWTAPHPKPGTGHGTYTIGGGTSGTGTSGGAPSNPYAAAQAHADAQEMAARRRAQQKWLGQASTMQQQIDALKIALGPKGLRNALDEQLRSVRFESAKSDQWLLEDYRRRLGDLNIGALSNEKEAADKGYARIANRGRERANAMSEATLNGAGESDLLRSQGMALRNWNASQSEGNRAFYDTLNSTNAALTDLSVDTGAARRQVFTGANAQRNSLWTEYYSNRSDILNQLGNAFGHQAEYYGLANEAIPQAGTKQNQTRASNMSGDYYTRMAKTGGMAWHDPGIPDRIANWTGAAAYEGRLNNDVGANKLTEIAPPKPEGASLRKWQT